MKKYFLTKKTICMDYVTIEAKSKKEALRKVWDNLEWQHDTMKGAKEYPFKAKLIKLT